MRTKVFKSGNSKAVRLPADSAYEIGAEVEVTPMGKVTTIRPAIGSLREAVEILRKMPKPRTVELVERTQTRDTLDDV